MAFTFSNLADIMNQNGLDIVYSSITTQQILMNAIVAFGIAIFIYWIYKKTFTGVLYNRNFNVTIVLTSLVTAFVVMVIAGNIALALGMVGALSIVRFRAAVKDTKDVAFLFWGISNGIMCGVGAYRLAIVSALLVSIAVYVLSKEIVFHKPYLIILRTKKMNENELKEVLDKHTQSYEIKSTSGDGKETESVIEAKLQSSPVELQKALQSKKWILSSRIISYEGNLEDV